MRLLLGLLVCATADVAGAEERRSIAVLPIQSATLAQGKRDILDTILVNAVANRVDSRVVSPADVAAVMGFEETKDAMGCDDVACAAEVAGALGVDELLISRADVLGDQLVLTATWMDAKSADALARRTITVRNDENLYASSLDRLAAQVFDPETERRPEPEPESAPAAPKVTVVEESSSDIERLRIGGGFVYSTAFGGRADGLLTLTDAFRFGVNGVWYSDDLGRELNTDLHWTGRRSSLFAGFSYRREDIDSSSAVDTLASLSTEQYAVNLGVAYWLGGLYSELKYQIGTNRFVFGLSYHFRL
ncbi:MAG: hypothetical protein AAFU77_00240 [Myxococcota bacterium]